MPRVLQGMGVAATVLLPIYLAASWIFRKLCLQYTRRQARAAAITFGEFTPLPLGISLLFAPIVSGYTGAFLVAFSAAVTIVVART